MRRKTNTNQNQTTEITLDQEVQIVEGDKVHTLESGETIRIVEKGSQKNGDQALQEQNQVDMNSLTDMAWGTANRLNDLQANINQIKERFRSLQRSIDDERKRDFVMEGIQEILDEIET